MSISQSTSHQEGYSSYQEVYSNQDLNSSGLDKRDRPQTCIERLFGCNTPQNLSNHNAPPLNDRDINPIKSDFSKKTVTDETQNTSTPVVISSPREEKPISLGRGERSFEKWVTDVFDEFPMQIRKAFNDLFKGTPYILGTIPIHAEEYTHSASYEEITLSSFRNQKIFDSYKTFHTHQIVKGVCSDGMPFIAIPMECDGIVNAKATLVLKGYKDGEKVQWGQEQTDKKKAFDIQPCFVQRGVISNSTEVDYEEKENDVKRLKSLLKIGCNHDHNGNVWKMANHPFFSMSYEAQVDQSYDILNLDSQNALNSIFEKTPWSVKTIPTSSENGPVLKGIYEYTKKPFIQINLEKIPNQSSQRTQTGVIQLYFTEFGWDVERNTILKKSSDSTEGVIEQLNDLLRTGEVTDLWDSKWEIRNHPNPIKKVPKHDHTKSGQVNKNTTPHYTGYSLFRQILTGSYSNTPNGAIRQIGAAAFEVGQTHGNFKKPVEKKEAKNPRESPIMITVTNDSFDF